MEKANSFQRHFKHWKSIAYVIVSLAAAAIAFALGVSKNAGEITSTLYSLITFFGCHLLVSQFFGEFEVDELKEEVQHLRQTVESFGQVLAIGSKLHGVLGALTTLEPVLAAAGRSTADEMVSRLKVAETTQTLEIEGRDLTYLCYTKFWDALASAQARKTPGDTPLQVCMTHTSDIAGWMEEYSGGLRAHHRKFRDAGGVAFRVLVDRTPRGEGGCIQYLDLMQEMREDGLC